MEIVHQDSGATVLRLSEAFGMEHGRTGRNNLCQPTNLFLINVSLPEQSAMQNVRGHTQR